jgi:pilus assembly protein CpaC
MTKKFFLLFGILFTLLFVHPAFCDDSANVDSSTTKDIYMIKGELVNITVSSLTRISITDPEVADIVNASDKEILVIAKTPGQTILFVWDEHGKRPIVLHVYSQNLEMAKERLSDLLKEAEISEASVSISDKEGKVIVSGGIPEEKKVKFEQIIAPFADSIINFSEQEENKDLVQINLQITELSTTLFKALGIDWTAGGSDGLTLRYPETLPTTDGSVGDLFKIGDFNRTSALLATVNALIKEGKGKILSQPKLVVVSGQEASFLVGGQIPIRTTTSSTTATQENVSFKDYGISMTITPKITKGKLDITLNTEISDIDSANAVGQDVAFTTRSAQTKLYLNDGQTIVLAGLIKKNRGESISRVPFVSKIPVVGLLFRNKATPSADTDTELVISLTPHILTDRSAEEKSAREKKETEINPAPIEDSVSSLNLTEASPSPVVMQPKPSLPTNMAEYARTIQNKMLEAIHYPSEAQTYGWEGTVKLGLLILKDGTLALATVKESSGYDVFDQDAVETAKRVAPYDQFPSDTDLQDLEVTIPIVYSLK